MKEPPVYVDELELPARLVELVRTGRWPSDRGHNGLPIGPDHPLRAFDPVADQVCFLKPPFYSIARKATGNSFWTSPCASPDQIEFDKTVCIADFGLGSDSPIVLDYSIDTHEPRVLWLKWIPAEPGAPTGQDRTSNRWSVLTQTFDGFADLLGLEA